MASRTGPLASLVAATLTAAAAGCQAVEAGPPVESLTDVQQSVAELAIATLAEDLKIPKEEITVESVNDVDWRNSSLGCPKPGMAYLDVITSGHKVTLRANGQLYNVHEADNKAFVCKMLSVSGVQPKPELVYGRQMLTAQRDLANRLGVPPRDVEPVSAEPKSWGDTSLDCPEAGKQYAEVITKGWVLTLRHSGRDFTYHADAHHVIPCPAITVE